MSAHDRSQNDGHRKRLRTRFLQNGLEGFLDYEVVELLLTLNTPRKDCKQTAKAVIEKFGSLSKVLDATTEDLQTIKGIGHANVFGLKLFQAISERYSKERITDKVNLGSSELVADFLQKKIGRNNKEHFMALYLDSRNRLIKISEISVGSLDSGIVHPREVFKEAIQVSSAQIIIAHNHPSGHTEPSSEDIGITRRLQDAARVIGIEIVDHIIVTNNNYFSFKEKAII